jgi:hypothetical protein
MAIKHFDIYLLMMIFWQLVLQTDPAPVRYQFMKGLKLT